MILLHGCPVSYAASCKAKNSLFCQNMGVWVCIPNQSLAESLCLVMALNHWHLIDGHFFFWGVCATDVRPGECSWAPGDWLGRFFKSNWSTQRQTLLPPYCTWPCTIKNALVAERGQIEHHDHNSCSSPPEYLSWASSLGFERAPWFFMWQNIW